MPIITTEMLRIDPVTFVVSTREPEVAAPVAPTVAPPLGRTLAGFALVGLAARAVELLAARR